MSGKELVRAFRSRVGSAARNARPPSWKKPLAALCIAASALAFGAIVTRAADDGGVYEVARQYSNARGFARSTLPSIFAPSPRPVARGTLSYAPVFDNLMPTTATGKRALDSSRAKVKRTAKAAGRSPKSTASQHIRDAEFEQAFLKSRTSYCVRSCDGFYFPVGNPDAGGVAAHEAACARTCPGSETTLFVANAGSAGIADARDRKGQRYEATRTAFNYRSQYDSACTCNGAPGARRNYSLMNDFTLRKGDLVMSREGLKVYGGSREFTRATGASLSKSERQALLSIEASSVRGSLATLSPSLKARITAQIETVKGERPPATVTRAASIGAMRERDGRQMRYVGPDLPAIR